MFITILQLYNFLSIETKIKLLELLNNDSDVIPNPANITLRDWLDTMQERKMSLRLYNCLYFPTRHDYMYEKRLNDIDKEDIISIQNAGVKCWQEFEKLREEYNESLKK